MTLSIQHYSNFNQFEIVNLFPREVNIKAPSLYQDTERAKILEILLCKQDAVESVRATPDLAAITIQFDPVKLPVKNLFALLETLLSNLGSKVGKNMQQINSYAAANVANQINSFTLTITGMSCDCCAIALQIGLNRETEIQSANVDYMLAVATISGALSRQEAIGHIKKLGYQACVSKL